MSTPWAIRAKAEKIKSNFKIKYVRVFTGLWASRVHSLYFVLILRPGNVLILSCLTPSEMYPLLKMHLSSTIKEVICHVKVVSHFVLPSSASLNSNSMLNKE